MTECKHGLEIEHCSECREMCPRCKTQSYCGNGQLSNKPCPTTQRELKVRNGINIR